MGKQSQTIRNKLAAFTLAGALMFGLSTHKANAQNGAKKDRFIDKVVNVLKPQSVSVSFGCIHWGGNTYREKGDFLGEYTDMTEAGITKEALVVGALRQSYADDITQTTLYEHYKSGNFDNIYVESSPYADTPWYTHHALYDIKTTAFNQNKNYGIFTTHDLGGHNNIHYGLRLGVFNNSYFRTSGLASFELERQNIFHLNGLSATASAGIVTNYRKEEVGQTAYLGNNISALVGASLGYTFKNGMNIRYTATPAFGTMTVGLVLGDKEDNRGLLSFLHNKKQQDKNRSHHHSLAIK